MSSEDSNAGTPVANRPAPARPRPVRSFVLREGRLTSGQTRAFADLWPGFGVDRQPGQVLDLPGLFGNSQPVTLEIGFGNGESLAQMAEARPEQNFLGLEVHRPGVGHLLLEIERRNLSNLRVMRADALELLREGLPRGSIAAVQLFFPDPWPKKRHHKRRIVQPAFVSLVARVLSPGGLLHAATDWEPYAGHMLAVLDAADDLLENCDGRGCFAPGPSGRPPTKFERRGERLGHRIFDLIYRRR